MLDIDTEQYCRDCKRVVRVNVEFDYEDCGFGSRHKVEFWTCSECGGEDLTEHTPEADPDEEPAP